MKRLAIALGVVGVSVGSLAFAQTQAPDPTPLAPTVVEGRVRVVTPSGVLTADRIAIGRQVIATSVRIASGGVVITADEAEFVDYWTSNDLLKTIQLRGNVQAKMAVQLEGNTEIR